MSPSLVHPLLHKITKLVRRQRWRGLRHCWEIRLGIVSFIADFYFNIISLKWRLQSRRINNAASNIRIMPLSKNRSSCVSRHGWLLIAVSSFRWRLEMKNIQPSIISHVIFIVLLQPSEPTLVNASLSNFHTRLKAVTNEWTFFFIILLQTYRMKFWTSIMNHP